MEMLHIVECFTFLKMQRVNINILHGQQLVPSSLPPLRTSSDIYTYVYVLSKNGTNCGT